VTGHGSDLIKTPVPIGSSRCHGSGTLFVHIYTYTHTFTALQMDLAFILLKRSRVLKAELSAVSALT
jgi:hypothetical protein